MFLWVKQAWPTDVTQLESLLCVAGLFEIIVCVAVL